MCAEAKASGAEVRELGTLSESAKTSGGFFRRPALVLDPAKDQRIVTEEQFGPALPICRYDDLDALIDRLNGEWAGLCSSVWTADPQRAAELSMRLRTGTTWVNSANAVAQDDRAPFGGFRMSGLGRELGVDGLLDFVELHTVTSPA
jgi:acyl-CoA reductase-like NAD-dependent aldehyde dehydrogenase